MGEGFSSIPVRSHELHGGDAKVLTVSFARVYYWSLVCTVHSFRLLLRLYLTKQHSSLLSLLLDDVLAAAGSDVSEVFSGVLVVRKI